MRVLRWPLAAVLLFLALTYLYALVVVVPWWALALAAGLWFLILRARSARRGARSLGSERQTPDVP